MVPYPINENFPKAPISKLAKVKKNYVCTILPYDTLEKSTKRSRGKDEHGCEPR